MELGYYFLSIAKLMLWLENAINIDYSIVANACMGIPPNASVQTPQWLSPEQCPPRFSWDP
jgi:hypothetical protein